MYCTEWGFGFGNFWHLGNLLFIVLLIAGVGFMLFRLVTITGSKTNGRSVITNYFHSNRSNQNCPECKAHIEETYLRCPECNFKLKDNCPSCGKIVKSRWHVCPYCETNLK
ncbi:MAG: zinc ribbon domain-containing protein [Bacteroidetes bacterium]|nr:zinc ribbon domain-containing protein [Bacteroidota bacterium]